MIYPTGEARRSTGNSVEVFRTCRFYLITCALCPITSSFPFFSRVLIPIDFLYHFIFLLLFTFLPSFVSHLPPVFINLFLPFTISFFSRSLFFLFLLTFIVISFLFFCCFFSLHLYIFLFFSFIHVYHSPIYFFVHCLLFFLLCSYFLIFLHRFYFSSSFQITIVFLIFTYLHLVTYSLFSFPVYLVCICFPFPSLLSLIRFLSPLFLFQHHSCCFLSSVFASIPSHSHFFVHLVFMFSTSFFFIICFCFSFTSSVSLSHFSSSIRVLRRNQNDSATERY